MDRTYAETVRLLLSVAPDVFANEHFAMKGGTAINLFVRDMPRLSVDIDVVYTARPTPRAAALAAISGRLRAIEASATRRGLEARTITARDGSESRLLISNRSVQVKVEVNLILRGTVLPVERRPLCPLAAETFAAELEAPTLAADELYGSKLVAAFDRQHPRDLFDIGQLEAAGGITEGMVECFVTYLAGHNRPPHEVLFPTPKPLADLFASTFVGMTREPTQLVELEKTRASLLAEVPRRLTENHRRFLVSISRAEPDWTLLQCPHAAELPAIQWKLINLRRFRDRDPAAFRAQGDQLERLLAG